MSAPSELAAKSVAELLLLHAEVLEEMRHRGVVRSANNPTGDLAEYLFCAAFGWKQENNSAKSVDARDSDGLRYQIKGRRLHGLNKSRQLSAIRDLDGFDVLAAVLFNNDYTVRRAALIPAAVVRKQANFIEHTNSHKFLLRDAVWDEAGVEDVTEPLRSVK
ncbi:MAG TPA: hypothetical protein PKA55_06125 [Rhodoblastus sp.]|nr:hypothetical protein [Rhodoblastus sp.]